MNLSNTLRDECGIDLIRGLIPITKLFSNFKENRYDANNIVTEYTKASNLKLEVTQNETQIKEYQKQLASLHSNISFYKFVLDDHRKNWDTYQQLEVMKFGINELQQLWLTVSEIAKERADPLKDSDMIENPVAFFIKMLKTITMTNSNLKIESRKKEMN